MITRSEGHKARAMLVLAGAMLAAVLLSRTMQIPSASEKNAEDEYTNWNQQINASALGITKTCDTPGNAWDIAMSGSIACVADYEAGGFLCINTTKPGALSITGSCTLAGYPIAVVTAGNIAYVASSNGGLHCVDITNPALPALLGTCSVSGSARGVAVSGNIAYVAASTGGLHCINVSDPRHPAILGTYASAGNAYDVAISGNIAYLAAHSAGLISVNVTNPRYPTYITTYDTLGYAYGVAMRGQVACVADSSSLICINASNPASLGLLGSYTNPGEALHVTIDGSLAFLADGTSMQVINITNPSSPVFVTVCDTPGYAKAVAIAGTRAYVADALAGVQIIKIADPISPVALSTLPLSSNMNHGVVVRGDVAFVSDQNSGDFISVDIKNPKSPVVMDTIGLTGMLDGADVSGDVAYVGTFSYLYCIDISNPKDLRVLGYYDTPGRASSVVVSGDIAYVSDYSAGLLCINVSNPKSPQLAGSRAAASGAMSIEKSGDRVILVIPGYGLSCFNVSNPASPKSTWNYSLPAVYGAGIVGNILYVSDYTLGNFHCLDIQTGTPVLLGTYPGISNAMFMDVKGDIAFETGDGHGFWMINVSKPRQPSLLYSITFGDTTRQVTIEGNKAYIAMPYAGMRTYMVYLYVWEQPVMLSSDQVGDTWPMFHGGLNHTGVATTAPVSASGPLWNYTGGSIRVSSAAVVAGRVYVGNYDHSLYCLNATTGAYIWSYPTSLYVYCSPADAGGRVYVGGDNSMFYCLNATTGTLIWSNTTGGEIYSNPAVADGNVYVGSYDHKLYCLNAITGEIKWTYTTSSAIYGSPAVVGGRVYIGSNQDCTMYCLNATTGAYIWDYTTGGWVVSSPAVASGRVYFGDNDKKLYCLDAIAGTSIWNYTAGGLIESSPAVAGGRVYVGARDSKLHCINATTGASMWNYTTGNWVSSSPAISNGRVYVGSLDSKIYCLDATSGAFIWSYTTGNTVDASPAIAGGRVYIGSWDGKMYCLPMMLCIFITHPADIQFTKGIIGNQISWTMTDITVGTTNYTIYRNSMQVASSTWTSGTPVSASLNGLLVGSYNYTIVARDGLGGWVQDTAIVTVLASAPVYQLWNRTCGTGDDEYVSLGEIWKVGDYLYGIGFNVTGLRSMLIKYDTQGNRIWVKPMLFPSIAFRGLWGDSNAIYAGGQGVGTILLVKYDLDGNHIWNVTFGQDELYDLYGYGDAIYLSGARSGAAGGWIAKYNSSGNQCWIYTIPTFGMAIAGIWANESVVYFAGMAPSTINNLAYHVNGTQKWSTSIPDGGTNNFGIWSDGASSIYTFGYTNAHGAGGNDLLFTKYSINGSRLWYRTWGGAGTELLHGGHTVTNGSYFYMVGSTTSFGAGNNDMAVVKFDADGNQLWNQTWGYTNQEYGESWYGENDALYAFGYTDSVGAGSRDLVLVKWSTNLAPAITSPADIVYLQGTTGHSISWNITDATTGSTSYTIKRNGVNQATGSWATGNLVSINVDSLSMGTYNYTLEANDGLNGASKDTVFVDVARVDGHILNRTWGTAIEEYFYGIIKLNDNIYTSGFSDNGGACQHVLAKWNLDGTKVWNKTVIGYYSLANIYYDGTALYTACHYSGPAYLIKWDLNGNQVWNASVNLGGITGILTITGYGDFIYIGGSANGGANAMFAQVAANNGTILMSKVLSWGHHITSIWVNATRIITGGMYTPGSGTNIRINIWYLNGTQV
nr:PQQ-binding-like beta-propeller repeat protein [Candidatus Sigynarchaeota archaeon]